MKDIIAVTNKNKNFYLPHKHEIIVLQVQQALEVQTSHVVTNQERES